MNRRVLLPILAILSCTAMGSTQAHKPILNVLKDGYPGGHASPEGAACDLARAFIGKDASLFKQTCIEPFGGGELRKSYEQFLKSTAQGMRNEAKKRKPSPGGPKSITKVYASRSLSKGGPSSYGYAVFSFKDVKFVDVQVALVNGEKALNRTMVIQDASGKWFVFPTPNSSPLLSDGLNDESPSTKEIGSVYSLKK